MIKVNYTMVTRVSSP